MTDLIVLDTGPLALITHPKASAENDACNQWLRFQIAKEKLVVIPGISDYELRRKLVHINSVASIAKLDALASTLLFAPITTQVMNHAALLWARARNIGRPTAVDPALDGDVILSAQALLLERQDRRVVIATTNVKHLDLFCTASLWRDIN